MLLSGRTWSQLFFCVVACAAQVRAVQSARHSAAISAATNRVMAGPTAEPIANTALTNAAMPFRAPVRLSASVPVPASLDALSFALAMTKLPRY